MCGTVPYTVGSGQRGPCVVDATDKFTQTAEVLWRKGGSMATLRESAPTLAWTVFYCFPVALHQRRFSFIILRFTLSDHFLQMTEKNVANARE